MFYDGFPPFLLLAKKSFLSFNFFVILNLFSFSILGVFFFILVLFWSILTIFLTSQKRNYIYIFFSFYSFLYISY